MIEGWCRASSSHITKESQAFFGLDRTFGREGLWRILPTQIQAAGHLTILTVAYFRVGNPPIHSCALRKTQKRRSSSLLPLLGFGDLFRELVCNFFFPSFSFLVAAALALATAFEFFVDTCMRLIEGSCETGSGTRASETCLQGHFSVLPDSSSCSVSHARSRGLTELKSQ